MSALAQTFYSARSDGFSSRVHLASKSALRASQQNGRMVAHGTAQASIGSTVGGRYAIEELDRVRLLAEIATADGNLPIGTAGTAVYRYRDGSAFEVEFDFPFHALLTLRAGEVARLGV